MQCLEFTRLQALAGVGWASFHRTFLPPKGWGDLFCDPVHEIHVGFAQIKSDLKPQVFLMSSSA